MVLVCVGGMGDVFDIFGMIAFLNIVILGTNYIIHYVILLGYEIGYKLLRKSPTSPQ